jgi:hypothetical protein
MCCACKGKKKEIRSIKKQLSIFLELVGKDESRLDFRPQPQPSPSQSLKKEKRRK